MAGASSMGPASTPVPIVTLGPTRTTSAEQWTRPWWPLKVKRKMCLYNNDTTVPGPGSDWMISLVRVRLRGWMGAWVILGTGKRTSLTTCPLVKIACILLAWAWTTGGTTLVAILVTNTLVRKVRFTQIHYSVFFFVSCKGNH